MNKKWIIILAVLAVLATAGAVSFRALQAKEVEIHQASRGEVVVSFTEDGKLVSEHERGVYASFRATVKEVFVEEGDHLKGGDLLVILDEKELNYRLQEVEARLRGIAAEIEKLEGDIEIARRDYFRVKQVSYLQAQDIKELRKDLETQKEVLYSERDALTSQTRQLREQKDDTHIYAPISGVVKLLQAEEDKMASPETPLMHLYQKEDQETRYLVETRVLTRDVLEVYEGMPVRLLFERREEDLEFAGEVKEVYPYAEEDISPLGLEEERVKVTVLPDFPGDLQLRLGYRVDVEFITERQEDVLWVPLKALFNYRGEDALMVVEDDRARVREVSTGLESRQKVVIEEGISEGDLVILDPGGLDLEDGDRVTYSLLD